MAQIKPVGSSSYVTISDYLVAAALMDPANDAKQNNVLVINKVPYQFNTLTFGSGGSGTFDGSNYDAVLTYYGVTSNVKAGGAAIGAGGGEAPFWDFVNDIEEGTIFSATAIAGMRIAIKAFIDRAGFTGAVNMVIADIDGLFNTPIDTDFTIPATSSVAVANLTTKSTVAPGTYTVNVSANDGISTNKVRSFVFVVSATSSSTPGQGWEDIDL